MANMLVFLRHAKTQVDNNVSIDKWVLNEQGTENAKWLASTVQFDDVNVLISSGEDKAYLTLKPLSEKLKKEIIRIPELGELKRPNSEKLTLEEYESMEEKIFQDLDYTDKGWETANSALKRFKSAVEKIDKQYKDKIILICAHGNVLSLYFAHLKGKMANLIERREKLDYCSYGIVENNKVTKDIV